MKEPFAKADFLEKLLWDVDVAELDMHKNKKYIIERILEYGDVEEVKWMFSNFDKKDVVEILKKSKRLSVKTGNYFYNILKLNEPRENFKCLKKPYTQKQNRF